MKSFIKSILTSLFLPLKIIFVVLIILVALIFALPFYLFCLICAKVFIRFNGEVVKIMPSRSALFAVDSIYSGKTKSNIIATTVVEGKLNFWNFVSDFESRIINLRDTNGNYIRPEFKYYVKEFLGFPFWAPETNFKIEDHIKTYFIKDGENKTVDRDKLCEIISSLLYKPYSQQRSPWEIYVVNNFKETEKGEISYVLLFKFHHSLMDGHSILSVIDDFVNPLKSEANNFPQFPEPSLGQKTTNILKLLFRLPYDIATKIHELNDDVNSCHPPKEKITMDLKMSLTQRVEIDSVKEIKNYYNVSFNAVVLNCYIEALRKFLIEAKISVPNEIHSLYSVPYPGHPKQKLTNHFSGIVLKLPIGNPDRKKRLLDVHDELKSKYKTASAFTYFYGAVLLGSLPLFMRRNSESKVSAFVSTFPASIGEWHYNNQKGISTFFTVGLANGNCGMSFTTLSYNGGLRGFFSIDKSILQNSMQSPHKLSDYFIRELEYLRLEFLA